MNDLTTQPNNTVNQTVNHRLGIPPATDVWADDDGYTLVADLPGVTNEHLEVTVDDGKLLVKGYRTVPLSEDQTQELRRSFTLPEDVDLDGIEASLTEGVLMVVLPRAEAAKPRRIAVATA